MIFREHLRDKQTDVSMLPPSDSEGHSTGPQSSYKGTINQLYRSESIYHRHKSLNSLVTVENLHLDHLILSVEATYYKYRVEGLS